MADDAMDLLNNEPIARKKLTIFFIIDTSGSMSGDKIGRVNSVMEEVLPEIRGIGGSDSDIQIAVMTYDTDVNWMYNEPKPLEEINWVELVPNGWTDFARALKELNSKLSKNAYMGSASLSFAPVLFLLSDGYPNPGYQAELENIKKNKWFKYALKVAVGIGDDADMNALAEFTGNPETTVKVNNGEALARMIKFLTVTSSQIGSRSSSMDSDGPITAEEADAAKEKELAQAIQSAVKPEDIDFDDGW